MKTRWMWAVWIALLAAAGSYIYAGSLQVGFVGDDLIFLMQSQSASDLAEAFTGDWFYGQMDQVGARYYRPLIITLVYLEQKLFGHWAPAYHATNLLMHLSCTLLLFWLVRLLLPEEHHATPWLSMVAALLFWIHPRHTEAVTMINGRTDVQCTLFYLLSVCAYLKARHAAGRSWMVLSGAAFLAALLSKEMAISLPFILVIVEWMRQSSVPSSMQQLGQILRPSLPHWLILIIVFGVIRTLALGGNLFGEGSYLLADSPPLAYYFNCLLKLVVLLLFPFDPLAAWLQEITHPFILSEQGWYAVYSLIAIALLLGAAFLASVLFRSSLAAVGLAIWLMASAPIFNQLGTLNSQNGDRYLYLPSVGTILVVTLLIRWFQPAWSKARCVLIPILLVYAFSHILQLRSNIHEWMIAGTMASSIIEDVTRLDRQIPDQRPFFLLNLPVFYRDKTVLNNSLGNYIADRNQKASRPSRYIKFLYGIRITSAPSAFTTRETITDHTLQQTLTGGHYKYRFRADGPDFTAESQPFHTEPDSMHVSFRPEAERNWLLAYSRETVSRLNPTLGELILHQGDCGSSLRMQTDIHPHAVTSAPPPETALLPRIAEQFSHPTNRSVHLSTGDLNNDGRAETVVSFGPTFLKELQYPGIVIPYQSITPVVLGHPFTPFPRSSQNILSNPAGEVVTEVGHFIPGKRGTQLVCATGLGGNQVIRLYEYTGNPMPDSWRILAQVRAFRDPELRQNPSGRITLSAGDLDSDGYDELVVGQGPGPSATTALQILSFTQLKPDDLSRVDIRSEWFEAFPPELQMDGGVVHDVATLQKGERSVLVVGTMGWSAQTPQPSPGAWLRTLEVRLQDARFEIRPHEPVRIFNEQEAPTGGVSLATGNADYDASDELWIAPAAYPVYTSENPCANAIRVTPRVWIMNLSSAGLQPEADPLLHISDEVIQNRFGVDQTPVSIYLETVNR